MSDPLDSGGIDGRILFSIGTKQPGTACRQFYYPRDLAFDIHRGLLFVTESYNHRVQVFSSDDGSFVSKFGEKGSQPSQMTHPDGIALDYDHDRIIVVLFGGQRVQSWSLSDQSFLSSTGRFGPGDLEFNHPRGIAIDKHHDIASSSSIPTTVDWCSCRRSISRSCSLWVARTNVCRVSSSIKQAL